MGKNSVEILSQNIEIPDIVQEKAMNAFSQICEEGKGERGKEMSNDRHKKIHRFWHTKAAAVLLAIVIGGGSITAAAAVYIRWSHGMQKQMNVSEEQMIELQSLQDTPVSFPGISDTQGDITVSVAQCLVDKNDLKIGFYVEGYELENNVEPQLDSISIWLDGQVVYNYEWGFYNGIDWDENDNPIMADGSPVQEDAEGGIIPNYRTADGKMEIDLNVSPMNEKGEHFSDLAGRNITIQMDNFGEHTGTWTLEWTLQGTTTTVDKTLQEALGNSGATVISANINPISITVSYDFKPQKIYETGIDENGNTVEIEDYAEPPKLIGVKLIDGTEYIGFSGGSTYGYDDIESGVYTAKVSLSRIMNPQEVESLLFLREDAEVTEEQEITLEQCYVVNIK